MTFFKKISSTFENHPNVYYVLMFCALLAFNFFLRYRRGDDWMDALTISLTNSAILSAGLILGDRQRRKSSADKKKIDKYLNNKENNEL